METRAHHLLIGSFVLVMLAALVAFVIWIARVDIDREFTEYDIYFDGSVAGLDPGGPVRYKGIPVGEVREIRIAPNDPSKILVTVKISSDVPILEDSSAVLEAQGLTGVVFVQIEGGMVGSPPLIANEGEERPVIQSKPSAFQELFEGFPNMLEEATLVLGQLKRLLNQENRDKISNILTNVETLTGNVAAESADIGVLMAELEATAIDLRKTANAVTKLAESADGVLDEDVRLLVADARTAVQSAESLLQKLELTVDENRGALANFTNSTLPEVSRLVVDARRLALALSRVAERFDSDPASVLFSSGLPEHGGNE